MRWLDDITDSSLSKLWELVTDREAQSAVIHEVAKSWTRLSDRIELIPSPCTHHDLFPISFIIILLQQINVSNQHTVYLKLSQCSVSIISQLKMASRIPTFMSNTSGCSESYPLFHHMDQKLHIKVIHLCCLLPACAHMLSCSVVSDSLGPHGLSLPGTSVHGIFHARILEWVAEDFLRICIKKNLSILQALTPLQNLLMKSNLRSDSPPHNTLKGRLQGVCTPGGGNITQGHLRFLPANNCYTKSEINLLNFII